MARFAVSLSLALALAFPVFGAEPTNPCPKKVSGKGWMNRRTLLVGGGSLALLGLTWGTYRLFFDNARLYLVGEDPTNENSRAFREAVGRRALGGSCYLGLEEFCQDDEARYPLDMLALATGTEVTARSRVVGVERQLVHASLALVRLKEAMRGEAPANPKAWMPLMTLFTQVVQSNSYLATEFRALADDPKSFDRYENVLDIPPARAQARFGEAFRVAMEPNNLSEARLGTTQFARDPETISAFVVAYHVVADRYLDKMEERANKDLFRMPSGGVGVIRKPRPEEADVDELLVHWRNRHMADRIAEIFALARGKNSDLIVLVKYEQLKGFEEMLKEAGIDGTRISVHDARLPAGAKKPTAAEGQITYPGPPRL